MNPELKFQNPKKMSAKSLMMSFIKPICTFEKDANVALKIIRQLERVKGVFVSWKHLNVILYPRGWVEHWNIFGTGYFFSFFFKFFFIVIYKQCELRIQCLIVVRWLKGHFFWLHAIVPLLQRCKYCIIVTSL